MLNGDVLSVPNDSQLLRQGSVYALPPSPLTDERELRLIISSNMYNAAGTGLVVCAEIELGTRWRDSPLAVETDYGLVLIDRLVWHPISSLGEFLGNSTSDQLRHVVRLIHTLVYIDI